MSVETKTVTLPERCCMTCQHYLFDGAFCRRFPPQIIVTERQKGGKYSYLNVFPKMQPSGLCGEWSKTP